MMLDGWDRDRDRRRRLRRCWDDYVLCALCVCDYLFFIFTRGLGVAGWTNEYNTAWRGDDIYWIEITINFDVWYEEKKVNEKDRDSAKGWMMEREFFL